LIKDKRQPNLSFLPLSSNRVELTITGEQIKSLIEGLVPNYDYILIDSPAGIDSGFLIAIECANEAIVVVTPEVPSIRDADRVIGILMSKNITKINLIINRIRPKMVKNEDMMSISDVTSILGVNLIGVIPDSETIIISSNRGEPIVLSEKSCLAATAFEHTSQRLMGEDIKFIDLNAESGKNSIRRFIKKFIS
jgi:septum site-determining protein MinD